jgi:hypothetical protein
MKMVEKKLDIETGGTEGARRATAVFPVGAPAAEPPAASAADTEVVAKAQRRRFTAEYKGWYGACARDGFEKGQFRPHDFRRTAVRANTRAGVGEQVVMKITGHKTRAMFDRYNITEERDLAEAAARVSIANASGRKRRARDEAQ